MQVTLVSHYGAKDSASANLIAGLQTRLKRVLSVDFQPYRLEQVHGTLVGLEGSRRGNAIVNQNSGRDIDFEGFVAFLNTTMEPITVRIGGYRQDDRYSFSSRGQHPYLRSFSIQGEIAVAIGWPLLSDKGAKPLDNLRREFEKFGVRHKWHKTPADVDDDFFFVLGRVDSRRVTTAQLDAAADVMRALLASQCGIQVCITKETLRLVGYLDPQLPLETSSPYLLSEQGLAQDLACLYGVST
jgi:hypothetical protein